MRFHIFLLTLLFFTLILGVFSAEWLDGFVSYYELSDQSHNSRQKRSANAGEIIHEIRAFNKSFTLLLHPDTSSFGSDHVIEMGGDGKLFSLDLVDVLVAGKVIGHESDSEVHGSLIDGRFEGEIKVGPVRYFVENAEKFSKHKSNNLRVRRSVVYRSSDVFMSSSSSNHRQRRSSDAGDFSTCGWSHSDISSKMKSIHNNQHNHHHHHDDADETMSDQAGKNRYRRESPLSQQGQPVLLVSDPLSVPKICGIFMQVDHLLYDKFYQETQSDYSAVANLISYLNFVIKTTNSIYLATNFTSADGISAGPYRNVQMAAVRTKIYQTESEFARAFQVRPAEQIANLDPTNFLNLVSRSNYDLYCASFIFTLRDFSNGVLGLAWIHYPDMIQRGGVCDRYGPTRYGLQSLNAGIITQVNYGELVSRLVSATTFAHELGHAFGAQHDNAPQEGQILDPKCYPGGSQGNFIMYSSANSGDKPNNQRFSYCSRDMIARNLKQIISTPSSLNCFKTSVQFCGNSIVDPGEECDCGFSDDCGADANCCGPADDPNPAARCKLRKQIGGRAANFGGKSAQCSLSNGVCCDVTTCSFRTEKSRYVCRQLSDCYKNATCDGTSAVCPRGVSEPDGKLCGDMTKMCQSGECVVSSCESIIDHSSSKGDLRFTGCQPERPSESNFNRSELCFLSCRSPSTGQCYNSGKVNSSRDFNADFRDFLVKINNGQPIQLMAGAPCDNDRGYCDVFKKCRPANNEGPLSRLQNLLFSESSISTVRAWVEEYWWAVMLIGLGVIGFMIGFVKVCAVHTPTNSRNLPPARTFFGNAFRRASFRPVLANAGPPQGRGHGHQRAPPPQHVGNGHATVATVSESVSSASPPPAQQSSSQILESSSLTNNGHVIKRNGLNNKKKAKSSLLPNGGVSNNNNNNNKKSRPVVQQTRPFSAPTDDDGENSRDFGITSPNIETLPRPTVPSIPRQITTTTNNNDTSSSATSISCSQPAISTDQVIITTNTNTTTTTTSDNVTAETVAL